MRTSRRIGQALAASAAAGFLAAAGHGQPTVSFGFQDYAELGLVRERIRSGYEELDDIALDLSASLDYVGLAARSVSQAGDLANVSNAATAAATLYDTLSNLARAANAQNVRELRDSLSLMDTSAISATLGRIESELGHLNSQTGEAIQPPTLYVYYATAVSGRARQTVTQMRDEATSGRASLLRALNNAGAMDQVLEQYLARLRLSNQANRAAQQKLSEILAIPGPNIFAQYILGDLILIESQVSDLISDVDGTRSQIRRTMQRVSQRLGELDNLVLGLNFALGSTPLSSNWSTGADTGGANAYYNLSFTGRSFSYGFTEIDGPFLLGTLTITNFITPGQGGTSFDATVRFNATRTVNDPILGTVTTSASVPLSMFYNATPNDPENNCGSSRDYFSIGALGINAHICETGSRSFMVFGQYDSPLRIVAIVPVPDPNDPDPAVTRFAYTLHVDQGTGSGVYAFGQPVTISASTTDGRRFVRWDGDVSVLADARLPQTTLIMPRADVNVRAVMEPIPAQYRLTVIDGLGGGVYDEGADVAVTALPVPGFRFVRWTGDIAGLLDAAQPSTFVRLTQNVTIAPLFELRDDCPNDPAKTDPGICGCGRPDRDSDRDGLIDCIDACPNSTVAPYIMVGGYFTGVRNATLGGGCSMSDQLAQVLARSATRPQYIAGVNSITAAWVADGWLTPAQRSTIVRFASSAPRQ